MKYFKFFILPFLFFYNISICHASIKLSIGIIHKRVINEGLVLTNELHSVETMNKNKYLTLKMKIGLGLSIKAGLLPEPVGHGPASNVFISGLIIDFKSEVPKVLNVIETTGTIGKEIKMSYKSPNNQLIELSIKPEIY